MLNIKTEQNNQSSLHHIINNDLEVFEKQTLPLQIKINILQNCNFNAQNKEIEIKIDNVIERINIYQLIKYVTLDIVETNPVKDLIEKHVVKIVNETEIYLVQESSVMNNYNVISQLTRKIIEFQENEAEFFNFKTEQSVNLIYKFIVVLLNFLITKISLNITKYQMTKHICKELLCHAMIFQSYLIKYTHILLKKHTDAQIQINEFIKNINEIQTEIQKKQKKIKDNLTIQNKLLISALKKYASYQKDINNNVIESSEENEKGSIENLTAKISKLTDNNLIKSNTAKQPIINDTVELKKTQEIKSSTKNNVISNYFEDQYSEQHKISPETKNTALLEI